MPRPPPVMIVTGLSMRITLSRTGTTMWNSDSLMSDMRIAPVPPVDASGDPAAGADGPGRPAWRRPDVFVPALLLAVFCVLLALVMARPTALTHADGWI